MVPEFIASSSNLFAGYGMMCDWNINNNDRQKTIFRDYLSDIVALLFYKNVCDCII